MKENKFEFFLLSHRAPTSIWQRFMAANKNWNKKKIKNQTNPQNLPVFDLKPEWNIRQIQKKNRNWRHLDFDSVNLNLLEIYRNFGDLKERKEKKVIYLVGVRRKLVRDHVCRDILPPLYSSFLWRKKNQQLYKKISSWKLRGSVGDTYWLFGVELMCGASTKSIPPPLTCSLVSFSPNPSNDSPPATTKKHWPLINKCKRLHRRLRMVVVKHRNYPYSADWTAPGWNRSIQL